MNRSNLRALPTPPFSSFASFSDTPPEERRRAESELVAAFALQLDRGESDEESPEYEQLEAAVDGTLDPVEEELFASRLAGDTVLQREFEELVALRNRLRISPAASRVASGRSTGRRWLGFAAAAVLLVAASLAFQQDLGRTAPPLAGLGTAADGAGGGHLLGTAQRSAEPLFADSFEGGTTDGWSN